MNAGFAAAAAFSLAAFGVHSFVGQVFVVRPLLAVQGLPPASRWLNFYCWHITTLLLAAMTGIFGYGAWVPASRELTGVFALLAGLCSGLSVVVALKGGINPLRFPSTSLFAAIAAAGAWGLV